MMTKGTYLVVRATCNSPMEDPSFKVVKTCRTKEEADWCAEFRNKVALSQGQFYYKYFVYSE